MIDMNGSIMFPTNLVISSMSKFWYQSSTELPVCVEITVLDLPYKIILSQSNIDLFFQAFQC